MKKANRYLFIITILMILGLAGCAAQERTERVTEQVVSTEAPTQTPTPTRRPNPTATPEPSQTPTPTRRPNPTATPEPMPDEFSATAISEKESQEFTFYRIENEESLEVQQLNIAEKEIVEVEDKNFETSRICVYSPYVTELKEVILRKANNMPLLMEYENVISYDGSEAFADEERRDALKNGGSILLVLENETIYRLILETEDGVFLASFKLSK